MNVCVVGGGRPVDDALPVQVLQPAADLRRVEDGSLLVETRLAHVVDVKLQVPSVHEGQHKAQGVLRLVGVRQTHLETEECHVSQGCFRCFTSAAGRFEIQRCIIITER